MRGLKLLLCAAIVTTSMAALPAANAQLVVNIGAPPVCPYGYYDYAPYSCAPMGFYGPGYFYNGIFLGMGPWSGWGYSHGWGGHRFSNGGGGSYRGGGGLAANRAYRGGGASVVRTGSNGARTPSRAAAAPRSSAPRSSARPAAARGGGSHASGGGASHGGGGHR